MSTFQLTSLVVALYDPERIPADFLGLKGYNIYHATLPLQYTDIPICIAHRTLKAKCPPGTVARIRGSATVAGRTLLVTASSLIPAAIAPVPTDSTRPQRFHCLPRIFLAGVVSSAVTRLGSNNDCIFFNVTIDRPDVFPGVPFAVSCWVHRDQKRFSLLEQLAEDTPVILTGVGCGWTWDDKLMVDVYNIAYNNEGPPATARATDPPNPFYRAVFRDGFPTFPPLRFPAQRSLLCLDAPPTLTAAPLVTHQRGRDPRLRGTQAQTTSSSVSESSLATSDEVATASAAALDSDPVDSLPSVDAVRRAARSASIRRMRARVRAAQQESRDRVSSPDVPLKLRISAKQLQTLA